MPNDKPTPEQVAAMTVDVRAAAIEPDPFNGAPRRLERRAVFGHYTGEYRVTAMAPATPDDVIAGRAERMYPDDDAAPLVVWKPVCQWAQLSEKQSPETHFGPLLDPPRSIN